MALLKSRAFLVILGLLLLALIIWFAGPYFAFADHQAARERRRAPGRHPRHSRSAMRSTCTLRQLKQRELEPAARRESRRSGRGGCRWRAVRGRLRRCGPTAQALRGGDRGAQEVAQEGRGEPLRAALVRHHRAAGRGQDHGARQLRSAFPARAEVRQGGAARRRRHAQLRLVVHRRGDPPRHGRPLYDAGLERTGRRRRLGCRSCSCCASSAAVSRSTA